MWAAARRATTLRTCTTGGVERRWVYLFFHLSGGDALVECPARLPAFLAGWRHTHFRSYPGLCVIQGRPFGVQRRFAVSCTHCLLSEEIWWQKINTTLPCHKKNTTKWIESPVAYLPPI